VIQLLHEVIVEDGTGGGNFYSAETVNITANTPPQGYRFSHWTSTPAVTFADANSASTTFPMIASAVTVTANYEALSVINVVKVGEGTITAKLTPAGGFEGEISLSELATTYLAPGDKVVLTAAAADNCYNFATPTWVHDAAGAGAITPDANGHILTITMPAVTMPAVPSAYTATATFTRKTAALTVTAGANGTVAGAGTFGCGSTQTITATPNAGHYFVKWERTAGNATPAESETNPLKVTMGTDASTYTATFAKFNITDPGSLTSNTESGEVIILAGNKIVARPKSTTNNFKFRHFVFKDLQGNVISKSTKNPIEIGDVPPGTAKIEGVLGVPTLSVMVEGCSDCVSGTRIAGSNNFVWGTNVTVRVPTGSTGQLYEGTTPRGQSYTFNVLTNRKFTVGN